LVVKIITHFLCISCLQAAGKYRQQGRNYIVEDGDIIFFKFNTPQQPKKK
jgi:obg-like ATPase 1